MTAREWPCRHCWRCPVVKYDTPCDSQASICAEDAPMLLQKDGNTDATLVRVKCGDWQFSTSDSPSAHTPLDSTRTHSVNSFHDEYNAELAEEDCGSCVDGPEDHDVAVQLIHEYHINEAADKVAGAADVQSRIAACSCCTPILDNRFFVPFDELCFNKMVGKGSFKTVYRGRWRNTSVAIVRMRKGGMVTEARLMQQLSSHPNLVQFYRWSEDSQGNEYVVLELVALGSLDRVLLHLQDVLRVHVKLSMCEQICAGMAELAQEGVLHRDLAARNVLVQSIDPAHVKVADFGLARVQQGCSPALLSSISVRWAAPEVLLRQEWSQASDVWAFGVTAWEIFSNGSEPYAARSDKEVLEAVLSGQRLARPPGCPREMYALMLSCWASDPTERPTFRAILTIFRNWQRQRQLQMEASQQQPSCSSLDPQDLLASVRFWATHMAAAANTLTVIGGPEMLQRQPGQLLRAASCEPEHLKRGSLEPLPTCGQPCNTAALSSCSCCRRWATGPADAPSTRGDAMCADGVRNCRQHISEPLPTLRAQDALLQLQLQHARSRQSCSAPLPWYCINKHVDMLVQQGLVSVVLDSQWGAPNELHAADVAASVGCTRSSTAVSVTGSRADQCCCTHTPPASATCVQQDETGAATACGAQGAAQPIAAQVAVCPCKLQDEASFGSSAQRLAQPGSMQPESWLPAEGCDGGQSMTRCVMWGLQTQHAVLWQQWQQQHPLSLSRGGSTVDAGAVQEPQDSSAACSIDLSFHQEGEIDPDDISCTSVGSRQGSLLSWSEGQDAETEPEQLYCINKVQVLSAATAVPPADVLGERTAIGPVLAEKALAAPVGLPHCSVPPPGCSAVTSSWPARQDGSSCSALGSSPLTTFAPTSSVRHSPYVNVRSVVYQCPDTGGNSCII